MNEKEKIGARELLSGLQEGDLLDLAKTVTKGKFVPNTRHEGTELILMYESDAKSLLSRKKISANLISHYLHCKKVKFSIDANKLILCDTVIETWNRLCQPVSGAAEVPQLCGVPPGNSYLSVNRQALPCDQTISRQEEGNQIENGLACQEVTLGLTEADIQNLGTQFVDWFYSQLRGPDLELRNMGPEHFFTDASCKVHLGDNIQEGVCAEDCARVIVNSLRHVGSAVPVANNPEGVKSQASSHGAVKVIACGTLHAPPARMLGAFEQAFLLVKDPTTQDNWKIKYTELRLKAQSNVHEITSPTPSIQY